MCLVFGALVAFGNAPWNSLTVVPICTDGSARRQSLAGILLEVLLGHMRSGRCQAVEGWRIIFGICAIDLGPKKHLNTPNVVPQLWDLVELYLANSSTLARSLPRTKHAMTRI